MSSGIFRAKNKQIHIKKALKNAPGISFPFVFGAKNIFSEGKPKTTESSYTS
jgi:hypothetical protein